MKKLPLIFIDSIYRIFFVVLFKSLLCFLLFQVQISALMAQNTSYEHFGTHEGLPSSQVFDVIQDEYGYLWFSTDHGLSRFDGYSFENYSMKDGLTDNTVFNFQKHNGEIWCSTFNRSLFSISGYDPVFKPYPYNEKLVAIKPNMVVTTCFYISRDNHVYMSFIHGLEYIHIDDKGKVVSTLGSAPFVKYPNRTTMVADKWGKDFFFCADEKPAIADKNWDVIKQNKFVNISTNYVKALYFKEKKIAVFTSDQFIDIVYDSLNAIRIPVTYEPIGLGRFGDNLFWVGFRYGGMSVYNLDGEIQRQFLGGKTVTGCYKDHEEGLWMTTMHDGVYYVKNTFIQSVEFEDNKEKWVNKITSDGKGNILAAMYNGDIYSIDKKQASVIYTSTTLRPALIENNKRTREITYASDMQLYNAFNKQIFKFRSGITNILPVGEDTILCSGYSSIVIITKNKKATIQLDKRANDVLKWNSSIIIGTSSGLLIFKENKNLVDNEYFINTRISDLETLGSGIAVGTHGEGVMIIKQDSTFSRIDKNDGLNSNFITQLYAENDSTIWVCSNAGINRIVFYHDRTDVKSISTKDGLISNQVTDIEIMNGLVWVGTREGICYFPVNHFENIRNQIKEDYLRITSLKINDNATTIQNEYHLSYNKNRVEIEFQAISFRRMNNLEYRYKLEGLENDWNYTKNRKITYTSLPPGNYVLKVQARSINHRWDGKLISISISVHPPYWETAWFRLLLAVVIAVIIYLFFRFKILSYNKDIARELLRLLVKKLKRNEQYIVYREQGKDIRISSMDIAYVKSSGNYLEIYTQTNRHVVRGKIGEFIDKVPDPLEYLRVHRSYIVRLDKVEQKGTKEIVVMGETIVIGETYLKEIKKIQF